MLLYIKEGLFSVMRRLSDATLSVVGRNCSRKFVSIGRIVKAWDEIMGERFASKAVPQRIQYRKGRKKTDSPIAILEIATTSADATMMHYQKEVILQRIESVFGDAWVADIKFVAADLSKRSVLVKKQRRPLTGEQKNHLSSMLDGVSDQAIYERLASLGEGVLRESYEG